MADRMIVEWTDAHEERYESLKDRGFTPEEAFNLAVHLVVRD